MRLVLANHSSYPRVGEGAEAQRVRRAYARRETGEIDDAGYLEVARDYIAEVICEQEEAGVELVTDGQITWYDSVIHLVRGLRNVERGDIFRFFDTNYLVRQPQVTGPISGSFGTADDYAFAEATAAGEAKAVLTGPYTMARHSQIHNDAYPDVPNLAMAYADILGAEIKALAEAGAGWVQIEEPSLLRYPQDAEVVRRALDRALGQRGGVKVSLVTYFGDAAAIYHELLEMPVDMLGFDLTYSPGLADLIAIEAVDRPVALGAIDGRNTMPDDVETVARDVDRVMDALARRGVEEVHLQPSCGLEYLPRDRAKRKLERMREVGDAVVKVGA